MKLKYYQMGKGVYQYYRDNVKGKEDISFQLAQKKLTRNIALAAKVSDEYFMYGNLHILLKGNTIIQLINMKEQSNWFYKSKKRYEYLNKKLGIGKLELKERIKRSIDVDPFDSIAQ